MSRLQIIILGLILSMAFGLRIYRVTEIPPSLNWDEVSIGYNAYSVLKTGKDEWGVFLPLHFKAYGEYKLPVQIYASIPAIAIFGLNEFGVRITPVIYGTLTVGLLFLLGRTIFQNNIIGLLAAFLLAISPWHIQLTRASFESSFSVMWVVLGIWLFLKGLEDKKWLIWSVAAFAISVYTYNSTRVFSPLFLVFLVILYFKNLVRGKKFFLYSIVIFTIFMIPLMPFLLSGEGRSRYKLVSVTDDPGLVLRINENRGKSPLPPPLPRLIHNKVIYTALALTDHYLAHFSPDFLFILGAPHKQHHVQGIGELYLFQAPFILIGLFLFFWQRVKHRKLLTAWLLLAFVPVSVTNDSIPHALRTLIAAPLYQLITAFGMFFSLSYIFRKVSQLRLIYIIVLVAAVCLSFGYYLNRYFVIYPLLYSQDWQYGYKEAVSYIRSHQDNFDKIIFTRHYGEPQMFTLFYLKYDPARFQTDPDLIRFETFDWIRVLQFGKFYFPDLGDKGTQYSDIVKQNPGKKLLFIGKPGDFPADLPKLQVINFLDGNPAFEIVEAK